jgi:hypothetical protein
LVKTFDNNFLDPVIDPQKVVYSKSLGYTVQPLEQFFTPTGALMMPWPMNRSGGAPLPPAQRTTYTWRDTSITTVAGPLGAGADLASLTALGSGQANVFLTGFVPTVGLPLLTEIRCYPDAGAFGLNGFKINLALNSSARPNFRAFSTGGVLASGQVIDIDPDNEPVATSGINPVSGTKLPPGTEVDNSFYEGQVDFVVRISRAHTVWLDTGAATSDFAAPVVEPSPNLQPSGTSVKVAFRGAAAVVNSGPPPTPPDHWHDATKYNMYGNPDTVLPGLFSVTYFNNDATWKTDPSLIAGAPFFQMRISMTANPDSTLTPTLSAVGVAYSFP